jgi:hypothetical protein
MGRQTLGAYEDDARGFASDWEDAQPPPDDHARDALAGLTILHDEATDSGSSGKRIHRLIARRPA